MHLQRRSYLVFLWIFLIAANSGVVAQSSNTGAPPANATSQQQPPKPKYPSIGLVLQGGGALGLAHVGVITWLEEHHIPMNYIAGTSMGGLVGGVYATGRNAAELRQW